MAVEIIQSQVLWLLVTGAVVAFVSSFGIGANDVANAFATSVGAKTLTLKQAIIVAAVFEFSGAFFMGAHVTSTIRKGIIDGGVFTERPDMLMLAMFCALVGTAFWLLLATKLSLPVSTTHTIVGGIVGAGLAFAGTDAVKWSKVWLIVLSWFASPALSGILGVGLFLLMRKYILRDPDALSRGYYFYPFLVGLTLAINTFFIIFKGSPALQLNETPLWQGILISLGVGVVVGVLTQVFVVPIIKQRIESLDGSSIELEGPAKGTDHQISPASSASEVLKKPSNLSKFAKKIQDSFNRDLVDIEMQKHEEVGSLHEFAEVYDSKTEKLFSYLQIITAVFDSFAHGSNDVANSVAPFAAMYGIYTSGDIASKTDVPAWVLAMGGLGIVLGLATWGYHIISAIGVRLTKITASRGFSIELGAALVVVSASRAGIPVSTTHCQVGATVAVGLANGVKSINWKLMANTFLGWVITLFVSGFTSAGLFCLLAYSPSIYSN